MTAAEATRNFGRVQEMVARSPVIVTHHGRDRLAILNMEEYERLVAGPGDEDAAQRRKLLLILDSISEGYISLNREWRYVTINRVAELFIGQPREELVGRVWTEAFPAAAGTYAEAQLRRAMYQGEEVTFDWDSVVHEGRRIHTRAFPLPTPAGGIGVLFANLGEKDRLEGQERLQRASLRSLLAELPGWALFAYDADGIVSDWSPSAAALLGWTAADIVGESVEGLFTPDELASGRPWTEMAAARRSGRVESDADLLCKDGARFACRSIVTAPAECPGKFLRIISSRIP